MDLTRPVKHPIDTGLKAVGWSIGLVRSGVTTAVSLVVPDRHETAEPPREESPAAPAPTATRAPTSPPRTQVPGDLPTPNDIAQRVGGEHEVTTPVGTTGAGEAFNPDTAETDLQQPGTEPLMDPATTKSIAAEAAIGSRGAATDKG